MEHPVTEMITGIDLVRAQIMIAAGERLEFTQEEIPLNGVAFEARINAEDPKTFMPSPGPIECYHPPGGYGVRMDTGIYIGSSVSPFYDSMIGKLIVHASNREEALLRLKRALEECVISGHGLKTTIPLFLDLLENMDVQRGCYHINWLEKYLESKEKEA